MNRRQFVATICAASGFAVGPAWAQPESGALALLDLFVRTLNAHDITAFAALFDESYVNHQFSAAAPPPPPGRTMKEASIDFFRSRLVGLPDLQVTVETSVASGDKVAASLVWEGTHKGPLFDVEPTGRRLRFGSCDIFRVKDELFVEHWGMGDIAGTLAQLKS